jgi:predicted RNA polymerase sigma factor
MDLASIYRAEYGRCVATLARFLGDINLAEEAVQDAFTTAVQKWETAPPNPGAWIVTTARNRAVDRLVVLVFAAWPCDRTSSSTTQSPSRTASAGSRWHA